MKRLALLLDRKTMISWIVPVAVLSILLVGPSQGFVPRPVTPVSAFVPGHCATRPVGARIHVAARTLKASPQRPLGRTWAADTDESEKVVVKEEAPAAVVSQQEVSQPASGGLPWFIDPNTRGGLLIVSTLGTAGVFGVYQGVIAAGIDSLKAGVYMSVAVTIGIIIWTSTYVFRVANKDMTYVKQLKEYEDAVLRKRLEELQEDEVEALLEEVEKESQR